MKFLIKDAKNAFKYVTDEVYLEKFNIDSQSLKTLFESWCNTKKLALCHWMIYVSKDFEINFKVKFRMIYLDLYGSCKKNDDHNLNYKNVPDFLKALSKTNLKIILRYVHINDMFFPIKDLLYYFNEHGFKSTVYSLGYCLPPAL